MEKIILQDNFLSIQELKQCINIIDSGKWKWNHTSSKKYSDTPFWSMNLQNNEFCSTYLLEVIQKQFSKKFKINRVYANAHTYGQDGSYHTDDDNPNCYTFCLYLTNIKEDMIETVGGHLYFKLPELNYKICFEPKFNRGILFPSNYQHKATSFSRYVMDLRICLAWKLEEII